MFPSSGKSGNYAFMENQRISPRRRIFKAGQIVFGSSAIECSVRDISGHGARITVQSPLWFPETFVLSVPSEGIAKHCHIAWKRGGQIGIAFDE
ncbi:PilZ domain-containing protein [Bradyrhizobium canariense]|jgi:hypothetical protein|uniref:PilZ domain-containing protein n=1 Tax=Bradyrhizobium canariense TaxID=255045 RepID=UPI0039089A40